jgi:hypothetical protein
MCLFYGAASPIQNLCAERDIFERTVGPLSKGAVSKGNKEK